MVDAEFDAIWAQVKAELEREGASPEDEGKSEDELKAEYRGIAERRVRLGLVLAKVGEQNSHHRQSRRGEPALAAAPVSSPARKSRSSSITPATLRPWPAARPLFEDKVVDFLRRAYPGSGPQGCRGIFCS
jgi:trigger factor